MDNFNNSVRLTKDGIFLNGEPKIILCASLFYFRIPKDEWEDRIIKLKASGYNCVDAYFPWNFHETTPNNWSFDGEKDVELYLQLLAKHGILVVARPGPYICSEWDGGSIPAWVLTDEDCQIRENDEKFLAYTREWYKRIVPIISRYQISNGGTVILFQIDNELDFFDCKNPEAYMTSLKNMAEYYGVTVPIFGCAGQANVFGATGWADGVIPTFNFYGDARDIHYGEKFHYYYNRLNQMNLPLMITETSSDHLFLRRQLAAGAKLMGAYNQVGGTNFGFKGSVNNWGSPENPTSFITTHYGWGTIIGAAGEIAQCFFDAVLFSNMIKSFGNALALSQSALADDMTITTDFLTNTDFYKLNLYGGGMLVCIPNLSSHDGIAQLEYGDVKLDIFVKKHSAPFIPINVPVEGLGLVTSNCELNICANTDENIELYFLAYSDSVYAKIDEFVLNSDDYWTDEKFITVKFLSDESLSRKGQKSIDKVSTFNSIDALTTPKISDDLTEKLNFQDNMPLQSMEKYEIYSGAACYKFKTTDTSLGVLITGASDIVMTYLNDKYTGANSASGCTQYYDGAGEYKFITLLWGHSNFADSRQPSLMIDSSKGMTGAYEVKQIIDAESNWKFSYSSKPTTETLITPQSAIETLISVNSWNTTRAPLEATYRKMFSLNSDCDSFIFKMENGQADTQVYVDGSYVGRINSFNPFIDFSHLTIGKKTIEITLCITKRNWGEYTGVPILYSGNKIRTCSVAPIRESDFVLYSKADCTSNIAMPINFKVGEINTVELTIDKELDQSAYIIIKGKGAFVALIVGDVILGRAILNWENAPKMAGDYTRIYMPKSYRGNADTLKLVVFSLADDASIEDIHLDFI